MKVITYLGFTLLSVLIQFCVMDYIIEQMQINKNLAIGNVNSHNKVNNLLKNISSKPHALYYRTQMRRSIKSSSAAVTNYSDTTKTLDPTLLGTTAISTTIFDVLYDENATETTTIDYISTTEIDNTTEITLFASKNKSSIPSIVPKKSSTTDCGCNLLFEVCDINCCCDIDCTSNDTMLFQCEKTKNSNTNDDIDGCISQLLHDGDSTLNTLFCVVKTNLPDKIVVKEPDTALMQHYNRWINIPRKKTSYEFKKSLYSKGDPIWLLKNGTIYYLDFATQRVNNYCTDRAPIIFLKDEKIRCIVKLNELEVFHIFNTEESMIISATAKTVNSTELNCSNLHCINWTILTCHNGICRSYNKNIDKPLCSESGCVNLAPKIDYYFNYYNLKIVNATIKLHMQNVTILPFMWQEITINFIMANNSQQRMVKFSGNPGYIGHLPVIVSRNSANYSDNFFNSTADQYIVLPENQNGLCVQSRNSLNFVKFGVNMRTKCRYVHSNMTAMNNVTTCKNIQESIKNMFGINTDLFVSPFGNPTAIKDEDWVKLQNVITEENVYGVYSEKESKLRCYNLINRLSLVFVFANVNEKGSFGQDKIFLAKYETSVNDAYFDAHDISIVLTIDINFMDVSKPNLYVYAGSPHLNIHLPQDFFFPFPQNNCNLRRYSIIVNIFCCIIIFIANKITLQ